MKKELPTMPRQIMWRKQVDVIQLPLPHIDENQQQAASTS